MPEPKLYRWDYDRSAWDSRTEAATFSVGIYQWLPKASGKGMKKSGTLRVNGYVIDAEAVYTKAEELCDFLNKTKARFGALPKGIRKNYSVPKPAGVAVPIRKDRLSGDEARTIRTQAGRENLLTAGFVQSHASVYLRRVDEIIQMIHFQTGAWGGTFTVNLGLHYVFTPPVATPKRIAWATLNETDCSMSGRIGFFLPNPHDSWFEFGLDRAILKARFKFAIAESKKVLDQYTIQISDPAILLSNTRKQIRPFEICYPTVLEASIEMRLGRLDAAERRLNTAIQEESPENEPRFRQLLDLIPLLRKAQSNAIRSREILEWLK